MKENNETLSNIRANDDISFSLHAEKCFHSDTSPHTHSIHIRWLSLKAQRTIHELSQILIFTENPEIFGHENIGIHNQMNSILLQLRGGQKDHAYMKVLFIITKYINGIRRFLKDNQMKGVLFYKKLFEGIYIAIIRETSPMRLSMY